MQVSNKYITAQHCWSFLVIIFTKLKSFIFYYLFYKKKSVDCQMFRFPCFVLFLKETEERKCNFFFFWMPLFSNQVIQTSSPADRNRDLTSAYPKQACRVLVSFHLSVVLKAWNMQLVLFKPWVKNKDKDQSLLCWTLSCTFCL